MRVDLVAPDWATHLLCDLTDWQRAPIPVAGLKPIEIPDDSYFEYAWLDADGQKREDPLNTNLRLNPWWPYACHVTGPDYRTDADAAAGGNRRPRGRVLRLDVNSALLGQTRRVLVYSPAGQAESRLPVVMFQDGKAYFAWGRVPEICDRLLERGEIEPAHLVFVPPVERTAEYFYNPVYREFLLKELLPAVEQRIRGDGRRIAWGASLGGLLSAQLAWERSDLFQAVVGQSSAFQFSPDMEIGNPFAGHEEFRARVSTEESRPIRWHLDCGSLEWLVGSNERLAAELVRTGHQASLTVRHAGHNWVNWRNGIAAGLRFALG